MSRGTLAPPPIPQAPALAIPRARRAVIRVPDLGGPKDFQRHLSKCLTTCAALGLEVVAVATEWRGVDESFANDQADVVVVALAEHVDHGRIIVAAEVGERPGRAVPIRQRRPRMIGT